MTPSELASVELPEPLPYHRELLAFVRNHERELWDWFASNKVRREHAENVRLDLLKSTYRLDRTTHASLYELADGVTARMSLQVPVTIYQAQDAFGPNVSLAYIPQEAHVVFHGNAQELLDERELRAVFGHEFGHFLFFENWDGQYLSLCEMLAGMSNDQDAGTAHLESARLFALYTEIFCDRLACLVTEDMEACVSSLVKLQTGLTSVSAESYIRQAEEILSAGKVKTEGLDHPEAFIRVRALQLFWHRSDELEQGVAAMIEGEPELTRLDLLAQDRVSRTTRRLIDGFLAEKWMQSSAAMAHARMFFDGYQPPDDVPVAAAADGPCLSDAGMRDYYSYLLLDFVAADHERTEPALAWAIEYAEPLGLRERLCEIAAKELKISKRLLQQIVEQRHDLIRTARTEFAGDQGDS